MHHHQYFNLCLHDNEELISLVQSDILKRITLHEWPLSCVQQLMLADGRKLIYKTQYGPTLESETYTHIKSDLLPWARTVYQADGHTCMLLEFIEGTLIEELDLSEEEVVRIGRTVLAQITKMAGTRPYWFDVSDQEKWKTFIQALLDDLKKLIDRGKFTRTNRTTVRNLEHWAFSKSVLAAICSQSGYVHHDFTGDNLFVLPNGYRVIDWQRPIWGPIDLDMVSLLMSLGFDPVKHVEEGTIQVMHFLSIHWFTQCAARWFPEGADHYDEQIVQITAQIEKSYIEE